MTVSGPQGPGQYPAYRPACGFFSDRRAVTARSFRPGHGKAPWRSLLSPVGEASFFSGMLMRPVAPLRSDEVVERLRRRLPAACTSFADDGVEVAGSVQRQPSRVLEQEQAPLAI